MLNVRKICFTIESINHEGGPARTPPLLTGVAAAVIENPFAGRYVESIAPFMDELKPLGIQLVNQLLERMSVNGNDIESYGKASIVGVNGELEHAALWHAPGGSALREVLNGKGFVPSTKMVGTVGARMMVPLL